MKPIWLLLAILLLVCGYSSKANSQSTNTQNEKLILLKDANETAFLQWISDDKGLVLSFSSDNKVTYGSVLLPIDSSTPLSELSPFIDKLTHLGWRAYVVIDDHNDPLPFSEKVQSSKTLIQQNQTDEIFLVLVDKQVFNLITDNSIDQESSADVDSFNGLVLMIQDLPFDVPTSSNLTLSPVLTPLLVLVSQTVKQDPSFNWHRIFSDNNHPINIVPPSIENILANDYSVKRLHGWMKKLAKSSNK